MAFMDTIRKAAALRAPGEAGRRVAVMGVVLTGWLPCCVTRCSRS